MSNSVQSPMPESSSAPISPSQEDKTTAPTLGGNPNDTVKKNTPRLTWTNETEALLQGWADIASCFKWMHENSFRKYSKVNNYFAIPIIVLSTVGGTLNVSLQGYVPSNYLNYAQAGIGGLGIFTGILTTLQNLFKYAQLSEAHNNVSIGWSKLNRNIQIELSVERDSRKDADSFIKICRSEYDRLIEQSPTIPLDIIDAFKKMYKEQNDKKKQEKLNRLKERENLKKQISKGKNNQDVINLLNELEEDELILPDICDSINHTKVYKNVLNNSTIIENQIDLTTKSSPIEQEIKDTMRDKINQLEAKTSGVHQYKLAMIGERLAPFHHQNNVFSHYKEIDNIKDKIDLPFRKGTEQFRNGRKYSNSLSYDSNIDKSKENKFTKIAESFNFKNNDSKNNTVEERIRSDSKIGKEIINDEIKELSLKGLVKNISNLFGKSKQNSSGSVDTVVSKENIELSKNLTSYVPNSSTNINEEMKIDINSDEKHIGIENAIGFVNSSLSEHVRGDERSVRSQEDGDTSGEISLHSSFSLNGDFSRGSSQSQEFSEIRDFEERIDINDGTTPKLSPRKINDNTKENEIDESKI